MLVSIIVPVYNAEKYIVRCFKSIACQSYSNIECIFIDDCSPDNSTNILNGLINEYSGGIIFQVLHHDKNKGSSAARNTGIKNVKGEYLYFLDSDDEIMKNCIGSLVALAEKYRDVEIVHGNTIINPHGSFKQYDITHNGFPEYTDNRLWLKKHFFVFPSIPVTPWNKLIKRSFILDNNLYFREDIIHEDEYWMFFAAKKIMSMAFTTSYCYIHYLTPDSVMRSNNNYKSLRSCNLIIKEMLLNIDLEIQRIQKRFIYSFLRFTMYKINADSETQLLLPEYRKNIKICLKNAFISFDFISCFGLLLLLLPYSIYKNVVFKWLTRLMFCNWKIFFMPNWYRVKLSKFKV